MSSITRSSFLSVIVLFAGAVLGQEVTYQTTYNGQTCDGGYWDEDGDFVDITGSTDGTICCRQDWCSTPGFFGSDCIAGANDEKCDCSTGEAREIYDIDDEGYVYFVCCVGGDNEGRNCGQINKDKKASKTAGIVVLVIIIVLVVGGIVGGIIACCFCCPGCAGHDAAARRRRQRMQAAPPPQVAGQVIAPVPPQYQGQVVGQVQMTQFPPQPIAGQPIVQPIAGQPVVQPIVGQPIVGQPIVGQAVATAPPEKYP